MVQPGAEQDRRQLNASIGLSSPHANSASAVADGRLVLRGRVESNGVAFEAHAAVATEGGSVEASGNELRVSGARGFTVRLAGATTFVNYRDLSGRPAEPCRKALRAAARRRFARPVTSASWASASSQPPPSAL